jgi:hypothetical protein
MDKMDQPQMVGHQPQMAGQQPQMVGQQPQMAGHQPQMVNQQQQQPAVRHKLLKDMENLITIQLEIITVLDVVLLL